MIKGYDAGQIRECLVDRNIRDCIPHRDFKTGRSNTNHNGHDRIRYVVERFFAWLKCGFHRMATKYGRNAENYLALFNIESIMMCWWVLG